MLLAACGGSRAGGPAWPAPRAAETDGGESLAPRQPSAVAAIEEAEDATPTPVTTPVAPALPATPAAAKPDKPSSPEAAAAKDEVLMTEEIIIEIED